MKCNKSIRIISCLLIILNGFFSSAQTPDKKALQEAIDPILSKAFTANTPGVAVLIAKDGNILYENAFGSANLELNVPANPNMVFKLASITKQFTAVAILQLVEKGRLSLQDSLQKWLPEFPSKPYTITIENLLTHTSGIKDLLQIDYGKPFLERHDFSPNELIDLFKDLPLEFPPGTKYEYSNSGYILLGAIIEKISGQTFEEYLQKYILDPLELKHTYMDGPHKLITGRVSGYRQDGDNYVAADFWGSTIPYAAGGLLSTVEDLYKWNRGLLSYKILGKSFLDKSFSPFKLKDGKEINYGYGWMLNTQNGIRVIEHNGGITGFRTNEAYYPEQDIFIAMFFNSEDAPRDQLSADLAQLVLGVSFQKESKIPGNILEKYTGTYHLKTDSNRKISIEKEGDHLVAKVVGQGSFALVFKSDVEFEFKNIFNAKCKFNILNGKAVGFTVTQNGSYEWVKSE